MKWKILDGLLKSTEETTRWTTTNKECLQSPIYTNSDAYTDTLTGITIEFTREREAFFKGIALPDEFATAFKDMLLRRQQISDAHSLAHLEAMYS